jgi:WD40 repeat protein/energy-coupling factor transporter ATP-binding protein EcfA2
MKEMTKTISSVTHNDFPTNPFVGLRPFESEEAYLFFGRNEQSVELMKKLHQHRFIGVVGSSGCGKSSLIRAGLIPKLKAGCLIGERDQWVIAKMKPGDAPFLRLADGLVHCVASEAESGVMTSLSSSFHSGPRTWELAQKIRIAEMSAVIEYLKPKMEKANANLLLLVDQFEEIINFGLKSKDPAKREEAESFVSLMLELTEQRALPIYVVMTMRSDFLGECDNFHGLPEALNRSQYLVPRLTRKQRQIAVEGPVRLCGRKVTPRLLDCVLNDAGDQSDQLPVMQHALMRTWEKCSLTGDEEIDLPHYEAAGKIKWALSNDAEKALDGLSPGELEITKRMFQTLTATDQDNRRTSHPSHFTQLLAVTGATPEQLDKVIERFRGDGRSFLVRDKSDDPLISISHESLIRQWKTLNDWINEELDSIDIYTRLADDAARYEKQPSKGRLWRDPELEEALEWRRERNPNQAWAARYHPKFEAAMNFLDKSREESEKDALEEERQRQIEEELKQAKGREEKLRRRLIIIPFVFGLFLLSLASATYAFKQKSEAVAQRTLAVSQRQEALKQEELARGAEATARQKGKEAEEQKKLAEESAEEARKERRRVEALRMIAESEKTRAEKKKLEAEESAEKAREQQYVAYISLAQSALEEANNDRAEHLLDSLKPKPDQSDLRGFPWYHLWLRKQQVKLKGYAGKIWAVAHGRYSALELLAAATENNDVIVWNAKTHQRLALLRFHKGDVYSVAFSPDGERMATAGEDKRIAVWDVSNLVPYEEETRRENIQTEPQHELKEGLTGPVYALAFLPGKNEVLASAGADGKVNLWKLKQEPDRATLVEQKEAVWAMAFSSDGAVLATAGADKVVKLWNVSARKLEKTLEGHRDTVTSVKFSGDDKLIATASDDNTVRLWDLQTGTESSPTLKGHRAGVRSVAFSQDGKRLATASLDSTVKVWDLSTRKELMTLEGHEGDVNSVVFLPDSRLATASSDSSIRLWDINARQYRKTIYDAHQGAVREVAFSPDGKLLASGSNDKTVKIWDADTGQLVETLEGHTKQVASVYFSPDGEMLASAGEDKKIKIWEKAKNWRNPKTLDVDAEPHSVAFSPRGGKLAFADANRTVTLWDINKNIQLGKLEDKDHQRGLSCVQFSPIDGAWLATASDDGWVSLWDVGDRKKLKSFKAHKGIAFTISFSSDDRFLASAGQDGTVKVWNLQDTKRDTQPRTLYGMNDNTAVAMFAPGEDATLAVHGNDGALKLLDSRTWEEIMSLKGESSGFSFIAFSRDGKKIATADYSGSITIWFAGTDDKEKRLAGGGNSKPSP